MTGASNGQINNASAPFSTSGGGAVTSVFGRVGVVVAQSGDYTIAQISGAGTAAAENLSSVITDNGAGALTIGLNQVTGGMLTINTKTQSPGFTIGGAGTVIPTGKVTGFFTTPYSGTITGWSIVVDTGTVTFKVWKIATGTAHPTAANSINTAGLSLATGTAIRSSTVTDFTTTAVTAGDIFAYQITAVSGVTEMTAQVEIQRS